MSRNTQLGLVLAFLVFCGYLIYPTIQWYFLTPADTKEMLLMSNEKLYSSVQEKILVSLSDVRSLPDGTSLSEADKYLIPFAKASLAKKRESVPANWTKEDIRRAFATDEDLETLKYEVYQTYLTQKQAKTHIMNLGLDLAGGLSATLSLDFDKLEEEKGVKLTEAEKNEAVRQTMDSLRKRIDQFGLTDPQITREPSSHRVFVDIPGAPDLGRIESFLQGSNSLSFHIVDEQMTVRAQDYFRQNPLATELPEGFLGANQISATYYEKDRFGFENKMTAQHYVLSTKDEDTFNGSLVADAKVGQDGTTHRPIVEFSLRPEGAETFYQLTSRNAGRAMAVVFQDNIRSVATISGGIPGGRVSISGENMSASDVADLTAILRSVAFPVEVKIDDWRVIGPTLGADNIDSGVKAIILGIGIVAVFMLGYYRMGGLAAVLALFINFFILLAILSTFGLTLTLTSLAGLVLTVGMAVDTNVIIFERAREEFRRTKDMRTSVKIGFSKAIWTVLDANITTFIAAFFLSILGTGPVQGFAWTLAWGILTSLFTAVFVTRILLDLFLDWGKGKLSLGWGLRYDENR